MPAESHDDVRRGIRRELAIGLAATAALVAGIGGWSAVAEIEGAVVAPGVVIQEDNNKRIQHLDGGIIKILHVREGDRVVAGDLLISLDATRVQAELDVVRNRLFELRIKHQRLTATLAGERTFAPGEDLLRERPPQVSLDGVLSVQNNLLRTHWLRFDNHKEQLRARINHQEQAITGYNSQMAAKKRALASIEAELRILAPLRRRGLVTQARTNGLDRQKSEVESDIGRLGSDIANANGAISDARLKQVEFDETFRNDLLRDLEAADAEMLELGERRVSAQDRLTRLQIRAPQSGYIHELKYVTIGAVVAPGETLLQIVPDEVRQSVEASVAPASIDQVHLGQRAFIRFPAFDQRSTPTVNGSVIFRSPDQIQDERTGASHYTVRIKIESGELARLNGQKILAGMPAEVMMRTQARTVISYLVKPLSDQMNRSFREE